MSSGWRLGDKVITWTTSSTNQGTRIVGAHPLHPWGHSAIGTSKGRLPSLGVLKPEYCEGFWRRWQE